MNKNEFYKQLMSEYSFDAEKIRVNAKKGRFAKQKISPIAIGLTAAVAALTVTVGTIAVTMMDGRNGIDLVGGDNAALSALSPSERIQNAIEQQNKLQDSHEVQSVFVTFTQPLAPKEVQKVLTTYTDDNIPVKAVYLADGSRISGSAEVETAFASQNPMSGVYIECAGSVMAQLQNNSYVALVEIMTESDFDTIVPISPEDVETIEPPFTDNTTSTPEVNDNPVVTPPATDSNSGTAGDTPVDIIPEDKDTVEVITPAETEDPTAEAPIEPVDTAEPTAPVETTEPAEELPAPPETEEAPVVTEPLKPVIQQLPEGVTLPLSYEVFEFESEYLKAKQAFFITDYTVFVRTNEAIALYEFDGTSMNLIESVECSEPKTHWIAENGGRMLITSVNEDGKRNKLWLVDGYNGVISDLGAEVIVMDGTITAAGYNADSKTIMLVIAEEGVYYTYAMGMQSNNSMTYLNCVFETSAKTSLLSFNGSTVYLAAHDGSFTQIHAVDINTLESRIIKDYDSKPVISQNLAFTYGIIQPSATALTGNTEIFDPVTETFIKTDYFDETISFGVSRNNFSVDGAYYTISGGAISTSGGISAIAQIDYKKSLSGLYTATAGSGYVTITDSAYSNKNTAGMLNFGHITSSGEADFIHALNGAIGMNNALILGTCGENGILNQSMLIDCVGTYYSANAAAQIMSLCEISEFGTLFYTDGGLNAINADDTELVINTINGATANGVLYIKAGTFGGKTAYRSMNITFVLENNSWKVDTVIGK